MRLIDVSVLKEWIENWFTKNLFYHPYAKNNNIPITELYDILEQMPSAQTELTDVRAIEHLQSTGWMQNHDKEMYEAGLRERLADDSDSYDSLIPSAQPGDDLISRQAAIDAIIAITIYKSKEEIDRKISNSVVDENGWIGAIADCIDEIGNVPGITMADWINAKHGAEVPDNDRRVLCLTVTKKGVANHIIGYYDGTRWCCGMNSNVVAWMELPDAPEWLEGGSQK